MFEGDRVSADGAASIYADGTYLESNPDWHAADSPVKARWIADALRTIPTEVRTLAEVGCGAGGLLVELRRTFPGLDCAGFDISPQAFALSAPKAERGLSFHHEDFTASERHFDVVMAIDVFEHVPDYLGFIRALKPRADYKLFHIPLDLSVQGLLRNRSIMHARRALGHLHYFDKETALATLEDCGLEVLSWRYTFGTEELPDRLLRTRALNLPRKMLRALDVDLAVRVLGGASMMVVTR